MKSISPDIVLKPVKEYILMAVGMLMYSFGWIGCILPAGGVGGGAAGLSLVLCNALSVLGLNFQIGTMVFIINAVRHIVRHLYLTARYTVILIGKLVYRAHSAVIRYTCRGRRIMRPIAKIYTDFPEKFGRAAFSCGNALFLLKRNHNRKSNLKGA